MNQKQTIFVTVVVLLIITILVLTQNMTPPGKNLEVKFTGVIEKIFDGAALDAESYMTIDGKKVVFNAGIWGTMGIISGQIIGFDLSSDIEGKKYIGKKAEVFAIKDIESVQTTGEARLTLQGNKKYYIKLLPK